MPEHSSFFLVRLTVALRPLLCEGHCRFGHKTVTNGIKTLQSSVKTIFTKENSLYQDTAVPCHDKIYKREFLENFSKRDFCSVPLDTPLIAKEATTSSATSGSFSCHNQERTAQRLFSRADGKMALTHVFENVFELPTNHLLTTALTQAGIVEIEDVLCMP